MSWAPRIWKVGLTGGIGSGKSNVAKVLFTKFNVPVIDADRLGHAVYEKNSASYHSVLQVFGPKAVKEDGEIDRVYLGAQVFGDPQQMKKLTDIVWPSINKKAKEEILQYQSQGCQLVFIEAAILIEAAWFDLIDELWVVTAPPDVACERIMVRNKLTREQALVRINSQLKNSEREAYGDEIISTNQEIEITNSMIAAKYHTLHRCLENVSFDELRRTKRVHLHRL